MQVKATLLVDVKGWCVTVVRLFQVTGIHNALPKDN